MFFHRSFVNNEKFIVDGIAYTCIKPTGQLVPQPTTDDAVRMMRNTSVRYEGEVIKEEEAIKEDADTSGAEKIADVSVFAEPVSDSAPPHHEEEQPSSDDDEEAEYAYH